MTRRSPSGILLFCLLTVATAGDAAQSDSALAAQGDAAEYRADNSRLRSLRLAALLLAKQGVAETEHIRPELLRTPAGSSSLGLIFRVTGFSPFIGRVAWRTSHPADSNGASCSSSPTLTCVANDLQQREDFRDAMEAVYFRDLLAILWAPAAVSSAGPFANDSAFVGFRVSGSSVSTTYLTIDADRLQTTLGYWYVAANADWASSAVSKPPSSTAFCSEGRSVLVTPERGLVWHSIPSSTRMYFPQTTWEVPGLLVAETEKGLWITMSIEASSPGSEDLPSAIIDAAERCLGAPDEVNVVRTVLGDSDAARIFFLSALGAAVARQF